MLTHEHAAAGAQQAADLVERAPQVGDVMQSAIGHDRVEEVWVRELLERDGTEDLTLGSVGVDRDDVVAAA